MTRPAFTALSAAQTLDVIGRRSIVLIGHAAYPLAPLTGAYRRVSGEWNHERSAAYLLSYDGWSAIADAAERCEESVLTVDESGAGSLLYLRTGLSERIGTLVTRRFPDVAEAEAEAEALGLVGYTLIPDGPGVVLVWFVSPE